MNSLLNRAAETKQRLELIYINKDGQLSQRIIKVLDVTDSAIKAYCYQKRQFRTFKLASILSIAHVRQRRRDVC